MPICCTSFSQYRKRAYSDRKHYGLRRAPATGVSRTIAFLRTRQNFPPSPSAHSAACSVTSLRSPLLQCWYTVFSRDFICCLRTKQHGCKHGHRPASGGLRYRRGRRQPCHFKEGRSEERRVGEEGR